MRLATVGYNTGAFVKYNSNFINQLTRIMTFFPERWFNVYSDLYMVIKIRERKKQLFFVNLIVS